jgi:hypothetical protein
MWYDKIYIFHWYKCIIGFDVWCLTIFQLYCGGQFYWWRKRSTRKKPPTSRKSLINFITWYIEYTSPERDLNSQR